MGKTSYRLESSVAITEEADALETSCSPDWPPKKTATRSFLDGFANLAPSSSNVSAVSITPPGDCQRFGSLSYHQFIIEELLPSLSSSSGEPHPGCGYPSHGCGSRTACGERFPVAVQRSEN